jgi:CheY-like chemotaxis protein
MSGHLLVVDDDVAVRRVLSFVLVEAGYEVQGAGDGLEAMRKVESETPALILVDIAMSGLGGLELLRGLSEMPSAPPAIVVSAHIESARLARSLGAMEFVAKPFDIDRLLSVVATALATEKPLGALPSP